MSVKVSGSPINIQCTEHDFPEFPELLFGKTDKGVTYIDASAYLQNTGLSINVFFVSYKRAVEAIIKSHGLDEDKVCVLNTEGHILIDSSLVYLLISFVNPDFLAYMFDRIDEMFSVGFTVSDTYLLQQARRRLPEEILIPSRDAEHER